MDNIDSSMDLKDPCPSQEDIGSANPMKHDLDSVDDFEHILKDMSPLKEVTAQFLQNETHYASKHHKDDSPLHDEINPSDAVLTEDRASKVTPLIESGSMNNASKSLIDDIKGTSEIFYSTSKESDTVTLTKDKLPFQMNFEDTHDNEDKTDIFPEETYTLDENKLIDFEALKEFDQFAAKTDDLIVTNNSEIIQDFPDDSRVPAPAKTSQSLPEVLKSEKETDVNTEVVHEDDSLHLKQTAGLDMSDNEDFVPEPLPKDYPEIGVIEPGDFLSALGVDNWFQPERLNPKVESLIYWRDVKKSGIAFGSGLAILLSLCYYSLISVMAYGSLTVLTASISYRIYTNILQAVQKTSDGHPFKTNLMKVLNHPIITEVFNTIKEYLDAEILPSPEKTREALETFVQMLNKSVIELRRRFLVEDTIESVKFGVILWAMTYVGSWFNGLSLIIMGFVGLFTLPKLYENNKVQIDNNLAIMKGKINEIVAKVKAVIPVGKQTEEKNKSE